MKSKNPNSGVSRRGFLKATGMAAGAVVAGTTFLHGLSGSAFGADENAASSGESVFSAACRGNCMNGCPLEVTVRDGKVVKVEAWPEVENAEGYRRICQRGRSHINGLYNPKRLQYPMRRVDGTKRGDGQWERISWDDAIDEITGKWKQYQSEFGPSSVAFSHGSGNYGLAFGANQNMGGYYAKLLNVANMTNLHFCYDEMSGKYAQSTKISMNRPPHLIGNSKCIVVWGANPTEAIIHTWHFIMEAKQNGSKLVVVDPNYTIAASKADLWIPLRPGSDPALALAMVRRYIEDGAFDQNTVKNFTTLPYLVRQEDGLVLKRSHLEGGVPEDADEAVVMLEGGSIAPASSAQDPLLTGVSEVQGIPVKTVWDLCLERMQEWDFAKTSEVCDIPEETLEQFYQVMKDNFPVATVIGLGHDHYENGFMSYATIALLSAVSGSLMEKGSGIDPWDMCSLNFYCNLAPSMPTGLTQSPKLWAVALPEVMETGMFEGQPLALKSIFFYTHNMLSNGVDRRRRIEALEKVEFIVTADIVETDTTRYSDIVLPVAHWLEQQDVFSFYSPFMTLCERAVEPQFECKDNYEIVQLLARGMGFGDLFPETAEEHMAAVLDCPLYQAWGITLDRLKQEKVIGVLAPDGNVYGLGDPLSALRANFYFGDITDPSNHTHDSSHGEAIDWEEEALPHFSVPHEAWTQTVGGYEQSEASKKYPFIYSSYRNKFKCHTQFGYNEWLLEVVPEPTVMINGADLAEKGVKDGDYVRVFNDRGDVVLRVVENNGIHRGMLVVPKGWQGSQFVSGHYADLTSSHFKENAENSYFFDCVCDFEKAEGVA